MLPEHFYFTGAGLLGYMAYAPVVIFLLVLLHRHLLWHLLGPVPRWGLSLILSLVLLSLPFWDVLEIGYQADRLCSEQGGLHVYKTVEAEGFVGASSIKYWAKYGFKYVESGGGDKKSRWKIQNGKVVHERIAEFSGKYGTKPGDRDKLVNHYISRSSHQVVDRETGEVLGELVTFSIYPGRFDRFFLGVLPVEFNPWICGEEVPSLQRELYGQHMYSDDLIKATIKPKLHE